MMSKGRTKDKDNQQGDFPDAQMNEEVDKHSIVYPQMSSMDVDYDLDTHADGMVIMRVEEALKEGYGES